MSENTITVPSPVGTIRGRVYEDGVAEFCGIPHVHYAQPFDFPERAAATSEVIDATTPRQREVGLSVIAPVSALPRAGHGVPKDLPVIAFVHGGRYESDHYDGSWYRSHAFAHSGAIVVSIGYRMRLEGFAQFRADEDFAYRGVSDVQMGLDWIQRCIESFGGDPTNVTLVGQSAGAGIALWLARRDHYTGTFRRLVAMSPGFPPQDFYARRGWLRSALGAPITQTSLNKVAERKPAKLAKAYASLRRRYFYGPAVGPYPFIPGELADVDILLTYTEHEMYLEPTAAWLDENAPWLVGMGVRLLASRFLLHSTRSYLHWVATHYPGQVARRFISDASITRWVQAVTERQQGSTWLVQLGGEAERDRPALHCVDLLLAFDVLNHPSPMVATFAGTDPERLAPRARQMHQLLLGFARNERPEWPAHEPGRGNRAALSLSLADPGAPPQVVTDPLYGVRVHFRLPVKQRGPARREAWE
ncbi:Carboxylesterase [Corynebacterium ciconiae DSM 44920]|uniref:carboxylesterase family protein n=1 Tax=Corynebacterium ciconiae TaxID=227319 RepID=UPI00035D1467|nr:carboxylesterase family protein [Corynebacterium ciconiae]WKD60656.1 Carboxylesterase [Corynebacterium ciconiae DSM 44920]